MKKDKNTIVSGKRKSAISRACIKKGTGIITINGFSYDVYLKGYEYLKIKEVLMIASEYWKKVNISIKVAGGGRTGQADAIRLVIAKGLIEHFDDEDLKDKFFNFDRQLIVADTRRKETKKPNRSKARAKRQKSYR